jgi:hypothetical protein
MHFAHLIAARVGYPRGLRARLVPLALLGALLMTGCAAGSNGTSTPGATTSPPTTSPPTTSTDVATEIASVSPSADAAVRVAVTVKNGKVSPPVHRVKIKKGQRVELEVASDVADEVHVHGFDISKNVKPGKPAVIAFIADQSGIVEVELESIGLQLVQLEVR